MNQYAVSRNINAAPEKIWGLLTDASAYSDWNPAVVGIDGTIAPGEKIKLTSTVNPNRTFALEVTEFSAPQRMVWEGGMPLGLFKGVRTFALAAQDDGSTTFSMDEVYTGLMEPMISRSMPDLTDSFEQFADGLKSAAEA